jgi:hypothetical protein
MTVGGRKKVTGKMVGMNDFCKSSLDVGVSSHDGDTRGLRSHPVESYVVFYLCTYPIRRYLIFMVYCRISCTGFRQ